MLGGAFKRRFAGKHFSPGPAVTWPPQCSNAPRKLIELWPWIMDDVCNGFKSTKELKIYFDWRTKFQQRPTVMLFCCVPGWRPGWRCEAHRLTLLCWHQQFLTWWDGTLISHNTSLHLAPHTSPHTIPHISHLIPHTSYLTPHISHLT